MTLLTLLSGATIVSADPAELDLHYKPVRDEIARLIRARTVGYGAGETGEFLNAGDPGGPTNPTRDEVNKLIDDAAAMVYASAGSVAVPEALWPVARRVVALGTVLLIEAGSEDVSQPRYDRFKTLYDEAVAALLGAIPGLQPGETPGTVQEPILPLGLFPAAVPLDW